MTAGTWLKAFYTAMIYDSKQALHRSSLASFVAYNCLQPTFSLLAAWVAYTILQSVGATYFRGITGITSYLTFAIIGLALSTIIAQSAYGGFGAVKYEQWMGTAEPVLRTPASSYAWLTGKLAAEELFGLIPVVTTILFGYAIFGLQLTSSPALGTAVLAVTVMMVSMLVLATLFAGISILTEEPTDASLLATSFMLFFAGLVFPISVLPTQVQWIAWCFPSTYGVDITRKALLLGLGLGDPQIQLEFVKMIAITLVLLPIGYLTFKRSIRRAEKRGSLEAG